MKQKNQQTSGAVAPSGAAAPPILAQINERYPNWELLFVYNLKVNENTYYAVLKLFNGYILIESREMDEIAKEVYDILTSTTTLKEVETPFLAGKGSSAEYAFWEFMTSESPDCRHVTQKDIVDYVKGIDKVTKIRYCQKDGHALQFIREFINVFLQKHFVSNHIKLRWSK